MGPGTGTSTAPHTVIAGNTRGGTGVWSQMRLAEAASAPVAAIDRATAGIVGHDEPMLAWLPALARVPGT